ncbi:5867_t:CDS:2, partial [Dentiscutata erythropus]
MDSYEDYEEINSSDSELSDNEIEAYNSINFEYLIQESDEESNSQDNSTEITKIPVVGTVRSSERTRKRPRGSRASKSNCDIEPLASSIKKVYKKMYMPSLNVAVDEMIAHFSGRSVHITFSFSSHIEKTANLPTIQGINEIGQHVCHLVFQLLLEKTTVRTNSAKFSKELKVHNIKSLEWDTLSEVVINNVLTILWVDNGPVTILSTIHNITGNKSRINSCRNWLPLFFWLLDTSIVNAHIIYSNSNDYIETSLNSKEFHTHLVWELIQDSTSQVSNTRSSQYSTTSSLISN